MSSKSERFLSLVTVLLGALAGCEKQPLRMEESRPDALRGALHFEHLSGSTAMFSLLNNSKVPVALFGATGQDGTIYPLPESFEIACIVTASKEWKLLPPLAGSWERRDQVSIQHGATKTIAVEVRRKPDYFSNTCRLTVKFIDQGSLTSDQFEF